MSKFMQMTIRGILVLSLPVALSACLRTRSDMGDNDQQRVVSSKVASAQKEDASDRSSELNENMRDLRGRVEVLENKASTNSAESDKSAKGLNEQHQEDVRRLNLLQETVTKLDAQVQSMNGDMQGLRSELDSIKAVRAEAPAKTTKNTFEAGMEAFNAKDYKKSILIFQAYREKNPKAKNGNEATYRIGLSFQELGMKDEARTFYDEVIAKYPNSDAAKRAKARLKKLKSSK